MQRPCLHSSQAPQSHCSAPRINNHRLASLARSKPCRLHNPSSQQQLSSVVAAAAQPDRLRHVPPPQQVASGNEALQVYAELQQQQQAAQQDDSSWQQLVVQASGKLPNQADQLWGDPSDRETRDVALVEPAKSSYADLDYLSELLAIQQSDGPKNLGFFGTRNMGMTHQKLVEILSYAMVSTGNHIYTSGATGTNAAVIKGALRAENPELLTVILPQSLSRQPQESQELLSQVQNVIEMPHNDELTLLEASRHCNREIISKVQQVICFAFHDSRLLLETCAEAKDSKKIVTLFYLD